LGQGSGLRAARRGAEGKDDGELIENDGGILDEHGVWEIRLCGEGNNTSAEFIEKPFVGEMLRTGDFEINGLARNKT
jgi:hypothetical protein